MTQLVCQKQVSGRKIRRENVSVVPFVEVRLALVTYGSADGHLTERSCVQDDHRSHGRGQEVRREVEERNQACVN